MGVLIKTLRTVLCLWVAGAGCSSCFDRAKPGKTPPGGAAATPEGKENEEEVRPFPQRLRKPAVAGSWYPDDREELAKLVDGYLEQAAPAAGVAGEVIGLISPHAGYSFSGKAAATGFKLLRGRDIRRVVVLAVSHQVPFRGASIADVTHYETPLGLIPLDREAVARLRREKVVGTVEAAHQREHSLEIQLPLLQRVLTKGFSLVPVLLSRMEEQDYTVLAKALADVVDQHTVVVASSDFTHRGPNYSYELPAGQGSIKDRLAKLDQGSIDRILKLSRKELLAYAQSTGTTICGLAPIAVLLELLAAQQGIKGHLVSHYTSGDVTGSWTNTVTYIDIAFTGSWPKRSKLEQARSAGEKVFPLSVADKRTLLKLARASLEASVRRGSYDPRVLDAAAVPPSLRRKAGAFVTLKCKQRSGAACVGKGDGLRGCIGTIPPIDPVVEAVTQRAASAALEDPRFPTVSADELKHITVEVSVLTPPREVKGAQEIVIGRHGIILRKEGRSATFLPQVAPEQGWDRETTLRHLAMKAGLGPDGWREGASFSVYEAIVFTEGEAL
jgi:AmmeMemoRadiSam system protein B/AmmeMemoRadiSam system protein A